MLPAADGLVKGETISTVAEPIAAPPECEVVPEVKSGLEVVIGDTTRSCGRAVRSRSLAKESSHPQVVADRA